MGFKNKKAAGFGCYGWSGESPKEIAEKLREAGLEVVSDSLGILWNPNSEAAKSCIDFGRDFVAKL